LKEERRRLPKGVKWLFNDKNIFIGVLWQPCTMPRLTDKQNTAIMIELASTADGRLYAGSFARNKHDDAR